MSQVERRGRVVYIDDSPMNRKLVERIFMNHPELDLITTEAGDSGLEVMRREGADVVLLDLNIPGMSGEEVLAEMRSDADLADVPVIILSGEASETDRDRLLSAGADSYVTKPFDLEELLAIVNSLLSGRPS